MLKLFIFKIKRRLYLWGILKGNANKNPNKNAEMFYYYSYGKRINWNNPILLDEKLNVLKTGLYYNNELVIQCSDKYLVREYIRECGLADILNEIYVVWDMEEKIDLSGLPDRFVVKRNNDSGGVLIVKDKKEKDIEVKIDELRKGVTRKYGMNSAEYQYQHIKPCCFCERYIGTEEGGFPHDYKFFVMNGKVRYILVCVNREKGHKEMLRFFTDADFRLFPVMPDEKQVTNEYIQKYKPERLAEMIHVAEILAEPFPFVRVDLYQYEEKVFFGELTFTPMGAVNSYINEIGQKIMGTYLDISEQVCSARILNADRRKNRI